VDGALAASVFHSGAIAVDELKRWLAAQGVAVRAVPAPGDSPLHAKC
jgi:imidazole glycerol-phosphate synthase subunit HisF